VGGLNGQLRLREFNKETFQFIIRSADEDDTVSLILDVSKARLYMYICSVNKLVHTVRGICN
jgi:hypothetical protein